MNSVTTHPDPFWIKPYVQLGDSYSANQREVVWFSKLGKRHWKFEYRLSTDSGSSDWVAVAVKTVDKVLDENSKWVKQLAASLPPVRLNGRIEYRLSVDRCEVFRSFCSYSSRVVIVGDWLDGGPGASLIAAGIMDLDPGMVVIPGDVVYVNGFIHEYLKFFFPVLNADQTNEQLGAPLLRSRLFVAAAGNHDISRPHGRDNLSKREIYELFGFLRFWRQPKSVIELGKKEVKAMLGSGKTSTFLWRRFGADLIRRLNFSFDVTADTYRVHWTVIDANKYMDWTVSELRAWLRKDLESARDAKWKFVVFHQPPFNSDYKYRTEQHMRLICDILQEELTDLVAGGHCHFYERNQPIIFRSHVSNVSDDGTVSGDTFADATFDGVENRSPQGVIYLVTGAGGQLTDLRPRPSQTGAAATTCKLVDDRFSFTVFDFSEDGSQLTVRQLSPTEDGLEEIDVFVIEK